MTTSYVVRISGKSIPPLPQCFSMVLPRELLGSILPQLAGVTSQSSSLKMNTLLSVYISAGHERKGMLKSRGFRESKFNLTSFWMPLKAVSTWQKKKKYTHKRLVLQTITSSQRELTYKRSALTSKFVVYYFIIMPNCSSVYSVSSNRLGLFSPSNHPQ